jgi:hypothetical protein
VTDKAVGDLCDKYVFSTPLLVPNNTSISAQIQYGSSSANESSFVFWGYQEEDPNPPITS